MGQEVNNMPNCNQCGEELCGAMRYCSRCGAKQDEGKKGEEKVVKSPADHKKNYQMFYKQYVLKEEMDESDKEILAINAADDEISIYQKMMDKYQTMGKGEGEEEEESEEKED